MRHPHHLSRFYERSFGVSFTPVQELQQLRLFFRFEAARNATLEQQEQKSTFLLFPTLLNVVNWLRGRISFRFGAKKTQFGIRDGRLVQGVAFCKNRVLYGRFLFAIKMKYVQVSDALLFCSVAHRRCRFNKYLTSRRLAEPASISGR